MSLFRRRKKIKPAEFAQRWHDLQKHCANRRTWPLAIQEADRLLGEALKSKGYKGKTHGERLVAAQRDLTSNDTVWVGHKLCNRMKEEGVDVRTLKKKDMVIALAGFRQALRDLEVLET